MSCDLYVFYNLGVILTGTGRTSFSAIVRTVTFEDVPEAYRPGILFEGKVFSLSRETTGSYHIDAVTTPHDTYLNCIHIHARLVDS